MKELLVLISLLGNLQVTAYRAVPDQTDDSPTWTSIGDRTTQFGCAVSQDLLKSHRVSYGDILYVEGEGFRVVNDCMNARFKNSIDLFVMSYQEEKRVGVSHKRVWLLRKQGVLQWNANGKEELSKSRIPIPENRMWIIALVSGVLIGIFLTYLRTR